MKRSKPENGSLTDTKPTGAKQNASPLAKELGDIRQAISELDDQLLSILFDRRQLSRKVAKEKQNIDKPLRDQIREKQLLESLVKKAGKYSLDSHYITKLYNAIIEDSVQFQQHFLQAINHPDLKSDRPKTLAVLGGKGAYSYLAAKKHFSNSDNQYLACSSFEKVIRSVQEDDAEFGVIPIENTTSGGITEVYDLLLESDLNVIGEEKYAVNHCLVGKKDSQLADIVTIAAHPEANKQCSKSLKKMTSARISLVQSTAHAVQAVVDQEHSQLAAIASEDAAQLFNLKVLARDITNQTENITRFLVLSKQIINVSLAVQCKTTIALSTGQQPGALAEVLMLFKEASIPLSRLESRPIANRPWEQMFHIDLVGNIRDSRLKNVLDQLPKLCPFFRIFGSYPTEDIAATKISAQSLASSKINLMEQDLRSDKKTSNREKESSQAIERPSSPIRTSLCKQHHLVSRQYKSDDTVIEVAGIKIGAGQFTVIAEPRDIDTELEAYTCAKHAIESGGVILSGNYFQSERLNEKQNISKSDKISWLKNAGNKYAMPIIAEVFDAKEAKQLVKNADILSVSPKNIHNFELLKTLGQMNCPVILQRSYFVSIKEFLSAAEVIASHGNMQVILSENGSRSSADLKDISLDLQAIILLKELTHLPIIVSPNECAYDVDSIASLTKAAMAIGVNGVVVEFSSKEDKILSAGHSVLSFSQLAEMIQTIHQ